MRFNLTIWLYQGKMVMEYRDSEGSLLKGGSRQDKKVQEGF